MALPRWIPLLAACCAGCGAPAQPPSTTVTASATAAAPASAATSATAAASASASAPASATASASASASAPASAAASVSVSAPAPAPAPAAFPPPGFAPLHERTAQPGDGVWTAMPEGARGGSAVMVRTTAHPHTLKRHPYVAVVAIDLTRVDLRLVAGTLEPESKTVPPERRPGLVPPADQADLIAVFNGGFMARHGHYGMGLDGDTFVPPRPDACTVALLRDGGVRIRTWTELAATASALSAFRQTPPCIIEQGALHPRLDPDPRPRLWSAAENGEVEIRRSALGLDASGRVLFYGLGEWVTVKALADVMKAAGAVDAAQLDVNWSYTRFLLFGRPSPAEPLQVLSTLIPKIKHTREGYVTNPSERDFFYLKRATRSAPP